MTKKVLISLAVIFLGLMLLSGPGCGKQWVLFYDKAITGCVVDAETGRPIENVIVVGMWQLTQYLSHGHGGYAKIAIATTDKEGKFRIPFWITFKPWKYHSPMDELAPKIVIYKPGYEIYWSHKIMRLGFPGDYSKTSDEKQKFREEYSIDPAKLNRSYNDEAIWKNYGEFEFERAPYEFFSKKQLRDVFDTIKKAVFQLPDTNNKAREKIRKDVDEYRQHWLERKK